MPDKYISIVNWSEYQHYGDRNPPWVKIYNKMLTSVGFNSLPERAQLRFIKLMLLASRCENLIPNNHQALRLVGGFSKKDREALESGGFICLHNASKEPPNKANIMLAKSLQPPARVARAGEEFRVQSKDNISNSNFDNLAAQLNFQDYRKSRIPRDLLGGLSRKQCWYRKRQLTLIIQKAKKGKSGYGAWVDEELAEIEAKL